MFVRPHATSLKWLTPTEPSSELAYSSVPRLLACPLNTNLSCKQQLSGPGDVLNNGCCMLLLGAARWPQHAAPQHTTSSGAGCQCCWCRLNCCCSLASQCRTQTATAVTTLAASEAYVAAATCSSSSSSSCGCSGLGSAHQIGAWVRARLHAAAERAESPHVIWVCKALVHAGILLAAAVLVLAVAITIFLCVADKRS
jgi:hypothetical protein